MVFSHPMFNCTGIVFKILSRNENGYAPGWHANDPAESAGPVNRKGEVSVKVWDRSTAVDKAQRYVTYLYLEHVNSATTTNGLYTDLINREKWVTSKLQSPYLSSFFESLPDSVVAALGIIKREPPTKTVVD